jgi:hypothetical protein
MISMFTAIALSLRRSPESIATPCSVKHTGRTDAPRDHRLRLQFVTSRPLRHRGPPGLRQTSPVAHGRPRSSFRLPEPDQLQRSPIRLTTSLRHTPRMADAPEVVVCIGETGFEPATARPPAECATRLRHSPWLLRILTDSGKLSERRGSHAGGDSRTRR